MTGTTHKIIEGDVLEGLRMVPNGTVDMIFTSPPFKDEDIIGDYWKFYDDFFKEALRVTKKAVIIIHSATKLNELIKRYPPKRTLVWGKGISQYSWRWNPILIYQISDDYKVNKYIWSDAFGIPSVNGRTKVHKYQDPEILYTTIIKMFKGCDVICDPFLGSGTTSIACLKLDKNFIGIEIDPKNIEIIRKRLRSDSQLDTGLVEYKFEKVPV